MKMIIIQCFIMVLSILCCLLVVSSLFTFYLVEKATALLIGSTGSGKSALGNFLLNPFNKERLYDHEKQYFSVSRDSIPHTNETKAVWETVIYANSKHSKNLTVIDTPGLNDVSDTKNMIYLAIKLQDLKEINTCIVVVKFGEKIDDQFNETLKYYSKLLPDLFKNNLIVVMTHYSLSSASIKEREIRKIDEEVIKRNIVDAVRAICNLPARVPAYPPLFLIDCVPVERHDDSVTMRDKILQHVFSQDPTIPRYIIAKPRRLMEHDKASFNNEMQKAIEQSQQSYSNNPDLKHELNLMDQAIITMAADIKYWEAAKRKLDTDELVNYVEWNTRKGWELHAVSDDYNLKTCPYKIRKVIKDGGGEHWKRETKTDCTLSGEVEGERFHGFRASIILQVYKRDKFEKEIIDCDKNIQERKSRLEEKNVERDRTEERHKLIFKDKSDGLIHEARQKFTAMYLNDTMSPDEALKRLPEIEKMF